MRKDTTGDVRASGKINQENKVNNDRKNDLKNFNLKLFFSLDPSLFFSLYAA